MPMLDIFGFQALWSPFFLLILAAIWFGYLLITLKYRIRLTNSEPVKGSEMTSFSIGILLLYIIKGSPLDLMGHLMFSAHMVQMAFLYLVIPPLLIYGVPNWLWYKFLKRKIIKAILHFFTKPLTALILFNGVFSFYHIPLIFDFVKTNALLHASYTILLFLLAVFMWWPLVTTLPEHQTLNGMKKVGYIFANGILLTPACALIIFADTPMYLTYKDPRYWVEALSLCVPATTMASLNIGGPEMFNLLSLLNDQQLGGVIMKILQEIVYGIILAQVFFKWYHDEQKEDSSRNEGISANPTMVK